MNNQQDIEEIKKTIFDELGIDIAKYQDESVAENLVDLLIFPKYIAKWVARPVLFFLLLYIVGFFVVDLVHIQYLIYAIVGLVLFQLTGVFAGVLSLTRKLDEDLSRISEYSLDLVKNSVHDIENISSRLSSSNRKDVMSLLFKGIIHVVTIPMMTQAIEKKVTVGSKLVKGLVKNSLVAVSNKLEFEEAKIKSEVTEDGSDSKFLTLYAKAIDKASGGISGTLGSVSKIVGTPFKLGFYITGGLLVLFLYLIW